MNTSTTKARLPKNRLGSKAKKSAPESAHSLAVRRTFRCLVWAHLAKARLAEAAAAAKHFAQLTDAEPADKLQEQTEKAEQAEQAEKAEKAEKAEQAENAGQAEKGEKGEKVEQAEGWIVEGTVDNGKRVVRMAGTNFRFFSQ
jgi:hypothetical protein